jgi:starch synthase (maltosyl-transferring)
VTSARRRPGAEPGRVVIENVSPVVDCGRFPVKRVSGETVTVTADIFTDGKDLIAGRVLHCPPGGRWTVVPLTAEGNDRWSATFAVETLGIHRFKIKAWIDAFRTWSGGVLAKMEAGQDVTVDLQIGAALVKGAANEATKRFSQPLRTLASPLLSGDATAFVSVAESIAVVMDVLADHTGLTVHPECTVLVERERARFGAWYELFPRSAGTTPDGHGTFADVEQRLPEIAAMGFDVLYLPPIHPIGVSGRKGPDNALTARRGDPGSPWAIGAAEGGHTAINPELGTPADFRALVAEAGRHDLEIALDLAFQCSPDHPWVTEHPTWFRHRPDGTIQYAENPPKRYEDIYPIDFDTDDREDLWAGLLGVVEHWVEEGIRIFRVDNPHTKPFAFWEWLLAEVRAAHPEVLFLAEAFTRPRVMERLAKLGFSQSYNYFAWRTEAWELREYFTELTQSPVAEFLRPNCWPNTPDILTEQLQHGGRGVFTARAVLAATLAAAYGVYGPAFELGEHVPRAPGSEEYLHSEKYEVRHWDRDRPDSLAPLLGRLNAIRRAHPALQTNRTLRFHDVDGDDLLCYSKRTDDHRDVVLTVVNADARETRAGVVHLDLDELGLDADVPFEVHDLLGDGRYRWHGADNYVELNPAQMPAHIFTITQLSNTQLSNTLPA